MSLSPIDLEFSTFLEDDCSRYQADRKTLCSNDSTSNPGGT